MRLRRRSITRRRRKLSIKRHLSSMVRRQVLIGMATDTDMDTGIEATAGIIVAGSIIGAMTTMIERLRHRARKHGDFTAAIAVTTVTITNDGSERRLPQLLTHFTNLR